MAQTQQTRQTQSRLALAKRAGMAEPKWLQDFLDVYIPLKQTNVKHFQRDEQVGKGGGVQANAKWVWEEQCNIFAIKVVIVS